MKVSASLATRLRAVEAAFDGTARLPHDPLGLVRAYPAREREVVAHVAAPLAYGAVTQLRLAISRVLAALGDHPTDALAAWERGAFEAAAPDFVYRMTRAADVDAYLTALGVLLRRHGTLLEAFEAHDRGGDDLVVALTGYVAELRDAAGADRRGVRYLLADPATGGAAKRWHLMLRWLVRRDDGVDLGCWSALGAHRLLVPLDTHVARMATSLGLTSRATVDGKMAREVTAALRRLDAADPLRFDMPLCHLGVARQCLHRWEPTVCGACTLAGACRWTRGRRRDAAGATTAGAQDR